MLKKDTKQAKVKTEKTIIQECHKGLTHIFESVVVSIARQCSIRKLMSTYRHTNEILFILRRIYSNEVFLFVYFAVSFLHTQPFSHKYAFHMFLGDFRSVMTEFYL